MAEKTEAQKRAQKAYMEKFAVARVRMEREKYEAVQAHAEAHGESVNGFINRAISEAMERDSAACATAGGPAEGMK
ncbi:Arc family DNA-binding protein [Pseudoflavonifractor sp. CLA-AP-H29]|uniref:Arc family DNA-binding protein n=1 Tax=Pseudoflavonifractor intestinihominis TaxID=3133171 RepID=A0ABV1E905_9FIRM